MQNGPGKPQWVSSETLILSSGAPLGFDKGTLSHKEESMKEKLSSCYKSRWQLFKVRNLIFGPWKMHKEVEIAFNVAWKLLKI